MTEKKKKLSEAEAKALLAEVTLETEQRLRKIKKNNRKVIGVIVAMVVACAAVLVVVMVMRGSNK